MDVYKTVSICCPCHNRTYDLKKSLPTWIEAANYSPPVEILILDYNSPDDLVEYMESMRKVELADGNSLKCYSYRGRNYYHMAHARNLSIRATHGRYFIQLHTDCIMEKDFIKIVRQFINGKKPVFMTVKDNEGVVILPKEEFIKAGGYDERFEFYSPEDKDLFQRLIRRGLMPIYFKAHCMPAIYTPDREKIKNYRLPLSKHEMAKRMAPIFQENMDKAITVANEGQRWGAWI